MSWVAESLFFTKVSKCLGNTMSGWLNVSATQCPGGKMSCLQNVRVSKCLSVKMSKCQNVEVSKVGRLQNVWCRNVGEPSLAQSFPYSSVIPDMGPRACPSGPGPRRPVQVPARLFRLQEGGQVRGRTEPVHLQTGNI